MIRDRIEEIMSAITFAEAGEPEKAMEFLKDRKTVLLAVSERFLDKNVLKYAMNISRRIEAGIDILYLAGPDAKNPELEDFASSAEKDGIRCRIVHREGCMKKAILDYTEKRSGILFTVVGSTPELDIECRAEGSLSDAWKRLKCPLVVVSKNAMPSTA